MSEQLKILSALHGIAPRSNELLRLGADLERNRIDKDTVEDKFEEETREWIDFQISSGIDIIENGNLTWQDHLRPIVKSSNGFIEDIDNSPVTRWFDDNRFYRKPTVISEPSLNKEKFLDNVDLRQISLSIIAPYTFSELCDWPNDLTKKDKINLTKNLYKEIIRTLINSSIERITLEEYSKVEEENIILENSLVDVACELASEFPQLTFSYIDIGEQVQVIPMSIPTNLELGVRQSTINHLNTIKPYGPSLKGKTIWQQVLDPKTTLNDDLSFSNWPLESLRYSKLDKIILTNSVDLELLPLDFAKRKVVKLAEFVSEFNQYLEEEL